MLKVSTHKDTITTVNVNAPNNRALQHVEQRLMELRVEVDNSIIIIRAFNTTLSIMDRTRQKTNKEIEDFEQQYTQMT